MDVSSLVRFVAQSLVDKPDAIDVQQIDGPDCVVIELHVDPDDMGKVIGKQGRIAKSIRSVVKAATVKNEKPVRVDIV